MAQMAGASGIPFINATIGTATTTCKDTYDAIAAQIDTTNHPHWFAFVDDSAYVNGGGDKITAIFGTTGNNQKSLWRNDSSYYYARKFGYTTDVGKAPAGTVFKVIYLP